MQKHSRIEVWYKVGTEEVLLGEIDHSDQINLLSMWRSVAISYHLNPPQDSHFRLKLYDDDGHLMARKYVSEEDAETVLGNNHWMVRQYRNGFRKPNSGPLDVVVG